MGGLVKGGCFFECGNVEGMCILDWYLDEEVVEGVFGLRRVKSEMLGGIVWLEEVIN